MNPLRELLEKAEKATPGPWRWLNTDSLVADHGKRNAIITPCVESLGQYAMIGTCDPESGLLKRLYPDNADAAYIAAANPTTISRLCRDLERLRGALEKVKAHGCCVMHNDSSCPGCIAHDALAATAEWFGEGEK